MDEVFLDYPFSGTPRSFADADRGLVFVLSGLSKLAGLPQMKLAWIAVAGALERRREALARLEHIADTYLSVGTAVQLAAPRLLELAPDLRRAIRSRTASNLEMLSREARAAASISVLPVDGGWYQPVRLPAVASSEAWALDVLRQASVYLHPGLFFGFSQEAHVVVSYSQSLRCSRRGSPGFSASWRTE